MKTIKEMKAKLQAKKKDNKGFSLVELIIVIAIMAILVGIIASQVIPYMEKSRESKDITLLDTCLTSFQTTMADMEISQSGSGDADLDNLTNAGATFLTFKKAGQDMKPDMMKLIGVTSKADLNSKFASKKAGTSSDDVKFGVSGTAVYVQKGSLYVDTQTGACK